MIDSNFTQDLQTFGISLHRAILDNLIGEIDSAIVDGKIRSKDGQHSVIDFIRVVLKVANASRAFAKLRNAGMDSVVQFGITEFADKGNKPTPVSDMVGLIYIAFVSSGEYCEGLRRSSAALIYAEYRSRHAAPVAPEPVEKTIDELEEQIRQAHSDHEAFPVSIDELQKTSQIVSKYQIRNAVKRDLIVGRDYIEIEKKIFLTMDIFFILVMSFRSLAGTDISRLPEILPIKTIEYFRIQEQRRANVRMGKRDPVCDGQIPLL